MKGVGDVDTDGEGSCSGASTWIRFTCSLRCPGRIGLSLELGSISDVWAKVRLNLKIPVERGLC